MKRPLILLAFCFIAQIGLAQNKNIIRIGEKTYSVGAYNHSFRFNKSVYTGTQNALYWDWAACIETCLNYDGLEVSQEQIVGLMNGKSEEPTGRPSDEMFVGTPQDLMFMINKSTPSAWGKKSKIYCNTASIDADVIFDELSADRPLIIGTGSVGIEGRAYVVSAMAYNINFDANGQQTGITPTTVTIRDPWPGGLTNRTINWSDFVILAASLHTIKVEFKK
jgi:hypothetical protein